MVVVVILAAIYSLGFIITPYWIRTKTTPEMVHLALTIAIGGIWIVSLQRTRYPGLNHALGLFLDPAGRVIRPEYQATSQWNIPWRGDEDLHNRRRRWRWLPRLRI